MFSEAEATDIETFLLVWDPIEHDVLTRLELPGYRPYGLLRVAHGTRMLLDGMEMPCDVWINYDDPRFPIVLGEGVGESFVACSITVQELLADKWAYIVAVCRCEWLVEAIHRLVGARQEITAAFLEQVWREHALRHVREAES